MYNIIKRVKEIRAQHQCSLKAARDWALKEAMLDDIKKAQTVEELKQVLETLVMEVLQ